MVVRFKKKFNFGTFFDILLKFDDKKLPITITQNTQGKYFCFFIILILIFCPNFFNFVYKYKILSLKSQ